MEKPSEPISLTAKARPSSGKQAARRLREAGFIPAIVYGESREAVPICVEAKTLGQLLHTKAGGNVLIRLKLEGDQESAVLIKELQHHPVSHRILHVDFHRVSLTKRIRVTVPLSFKGDAVGVRQEAGILEHLRWDLEVVCLPTDIPSELMVDVSELKLGQTWPASQVKLPAGVGLVTDPELPIVSCVTPKVEEIPVAPTEAQAAPAEPEVIKQKKPEEIAAEEASAAQAKEGQKAKEKEEKKKG